MIDEETREARTGGLEDVAGATVEEPSADEAPLVAGALAEPLVATALLALAASFAFQPKYAGTATFYGLLIVPLVFVTAYFGIFRIAASTLGHLLKPRQGDFTLGTVLGFVLVGSVWLGRTQVFSRFGDARAWLFAVYFQLGDARVFEALLPSLALFVFAFAHEFFFHGVLQTAVEERFGPREGYSASVLATGLVYAPSAILLEAQGGGKNPLFLLAVALTALVLGALRRVSGRLAPGIIARSIFLYFSIAQFRLPGL